MQSTTDKGAIVNTAVIDAVKISVPRAELAAAVKFVSAAVPKRANVAILAGILLTAAAGTLRLTAYNYEFSATATIACDGDDLAALIPANMLAAFAGPARGAHGDVTAILDGDTVRLSTDDGASATLAGLTVADYPTVPDSATLPPWTMLRTADVKAIGTVAVASSPDDTLPILTSVRFDGTDGMLELLATDRYRLARHATASVSLTEGAFTIPSRTAKLVAKMSGDVKVRYGVIAGLVAFESENGTIVSRIVDGDYPRWRSLWPASAAGTVTLNGSELATTITELARMLERNAPMRFARGGNVWQLEAGDGEQRSTRLIHATFDGDVPDTMRFNPKYLLDAVKAAGRGNVTIAINSALKPVIVAGNSDTRTLVMPCKVAG